MMVPKQQSGGAVEINKDLDTLAYLLDGVFRVPFVGWRFGFDSILGLIPIVGDLATGIASFSVLIWGVRYRVPKLTIVKMAINIFIDHMIGLVPIKGDILDIFWRANQKNVGLIRQNARPEGSGTLSDYLFACGIIFLLACLIFLSIAAVLHLIYTFIVLSLSEA